MDESMQRELMTNNEEDWKEGLPPGYRFRPSDYEAFKYYLLPKLHGEHILPGIIREVEIYQHEPESLPGFNLEEPSFYFTRRDKKHPNASRHSRCTKGGFWRITSKITEFKDLDGSPLGRRNTLVYYIKSNNKGQDLKTNYIMQEYVLDKSLCPSKSPENSNKLDDVVLCKIYLKKSSSLDKDQAQEEEESPQNPSGSSQEVPITSNSGDEDQELKRILKGKQPLNEQTQEIVEPSSKKLRPLISGNPTFEVGEWSQVFTIQDTIYHESAFMSALFEKEKVLQTSSSPLPAMASANGFVEPPREPRTWRSQSLEEQFLNNEVYFGNSYYSYLSSTDGTFQTFPHK